MGEYLLHVEALNHDYFIFDTDDLSTIRGGSLLLLDAVEEEAERALAMYKPRRISSGASAGLFAFEAVDDAAKDVAEELRRHLATHTRYEHATFAVAIAPLSGSFSAVREKLLAEIRWQQMRQPALSLAGDLFSGAAKGACEADGARPGLIPNTTEKGAIGEHERGHSLSVFHRRAHGRERKQGFYGAQLKRYCPDNAAAAAAIVERDFASDFADIADWKNQQHTRESPPKNLVNKIAVLYFDGNKFSRFGRVDSEGGLRAWDEYIKQQRCEAPDSLRKAGRGGKRCDEQGRNSNGAGFADGSYRPSRLYGCLERRPDGA